MLLLMTILLNHTHRAWFNTVTEAKPREIVIFLDLNEQGIMGNSSRAELRDVAIKVVRSLGTMDKVGVMSLKGCGLLVCITGWIGTGNR